MFLDRALAGVAHRVGEYGPLTLDDFPGAVSPAEMAELANTIGAVATNAEQWDLLAGRDSPQVALLERILENGPRVRGMRITLPLEYTLRRLGATGASLSDGARRELRDVWTHALRFYNDIHMRTSVLDNAARNAALEVGLDSVTEEELFLLCPALAEAEASLSAYESSFLADLDLVLARYR